MKLYHATRKDIYEDFIINEGLKPICIKRAKQYSLCNELIYFTEDINEAVEFAIEVFEEVGWVLLEVDAHDVLNECRQIGRGEWSENEVEAGIIGKVPYEGYKCVIPPDKIKLVYESN